MNIAAFDEFPCWCGNPKCSTNARLAHKAVSQNRQEVRGERLLERCFHFLGVSINASVLVVLFFSLCMTCAMEHFCAAAPFTCRCLPQSIIVFCFHHV